MLGKLLKPGAAESQAVPDMRNRLRAAQQGFATARQALQQAETAAEGARVEVSRARVGLAAHGDVDGAVARWNADRLRSGMGGPADLPLELAEARSRQALSGQELADAERAAAFLEQDAEQVRRTVTEARTELAAAVDAVRVEVAMQQVEQLKAVELDAARRRAVLTAFLNSRTGVDGAVPWPVQEIVHDPAHGLLLDRAPPGSADSAVWVAFGRTLLADADAEFQAVAQ
jgi:hypothetical protein